MEWTSEQDLRRCVLGILVVSHAAFAQVTESRLTSMGPAVPADEYARSSMVQNMLTTFCRGFIGALVEKRPDLKIGRRIKDAFHTLNRNIKAVTPFDVSSFSDEIILEVKPAFSISCIHALLRKSLMVRAGCTRL